MAKQARQLTEAVARLRATPHDLGAWQRVGTALAQAGRREQAAAAFAALGRAASELGQVALAVACARWLSQAKREREASALVDAVAETHCRGSDRIDTSSRPRPPLPPAVADEAPSAPEALGLAEAVIAAEAAIEAAVAAARERAPDKIAPTPLIRVLEPDDFRELVAVMALQQRKPGQVILDVGQPARALYWIARGTVRVTRDGTELGEVRANSFFGEIALVGGTTRTARVECLDDGWLLEIPAESLEALAGRAPKLARVLARYARSRLLSNVMRTSELFSRLAEEERGELLPRFSTRVFAPGEAIIERGSEDQCLYVLVSGRAEGRQDDETLFELGVGDGVGEVSLLARKPATCDVLATEPTVMLCLTRADFDDIAVEHPTLLAEVYKLLVEREQDSIVHDAEDLIV